METFGVSKWFLCNIVVSLLTIHTPIVLTEEWIARVTSAGDRLAGTSRYAEMFRVKYTRLVGIVNSYTFRFWNRANDIVYYFEFSTSFIHNRRWNYWNLNRFLYYNNFWYIFCDSIPCGIYTDKVLTRRKFRRTNETIETIMICSAPWEVRSEHRCGC